MNREEALSKAERANKQILIGMGALLLASLNITRVMRYLQGVLPRERVISAGQANPETTKEALEEMVEDYSTKVN